MWNWLSGKKTYIVSMLMAASSIFGFSVTDGVGGFIPVIIDCVTGPQMMSLLEAGGLAGLRAGVSSVKSKGRS